MKRVKVNEKKNLRNRMIKSAMKTQVKKFETALSAGEGSMASCSARRRGAIDKAVTKALSIRTLPIAKGPLGQGRREGVSRGRTQ